MFIAEAKAIIPGPSDIYVKQGSAVVLTCIVSQGPHELGQIFWLRGMYALCSDLLTFPTFICVTISYKWLHRVKKWNHLKIEGPNRSPVDKCLQFTDFRYSTSTLSVPVGGRYKYAAFFPYQPSNKLRSIYLCGQCAIKIFKPTINFRRSVFLISGSAIIDPKTSYLSNDIFEYPDRINITTESGDALKSR